MKKEPRTPPQTLDDYFDNWRSVQHFCDDTGLVYQSVWRWKKDKAVPFKYWPDLVQAAREKKIRGINLQWMFDRHI